MSDYIRHTFCAGSYHIDLWTNQHECFFTRQNKHILLLSLIPPHHRGSHKQSKVTIVVISKGGNNCTQLSKFKHKKVVYLLNTCQSQCFFLYGQINIKRCKGLRYWTAGRKGTEITVLSLSKSKQIFALEHVQLLEAAGFPHGRLIKFALPLRNQFICSLSPHPLSLW